MAATKPRISDDVTVCEIDGEAVAYDPAGHRFHYMNHAAALVLDLCDGESTVKQMAEAIADVYEMPEDEVERQVRRVIRDLHGSQLLEPTTRKMVEQEEEVRAERRRLLDGDEDVR